VDRSNVQSAILNAIQDAKAAELRQFECIVGPVAKSLQVQGVTTDDVWEVVCDLVARRLLYVAQWHSQSTSRSGPVLALTERGRSALSTSEPTPHDPAYMGYIRSTAPYLPAAVYEYVDEAVAAFQAQLLRASAVMLGVASEAAMLDLIEAFAGWLSADDEGDFRKALKQTQNGYLPKLKSFKDRLDQRRKQVPHDLTDALGWSFDYSAELFRAYRNDAGHPTGIKIVHDDCSTALACLPLYLRRVSALRDFFAKHPHQATAPP